MTDTDKKEASFDFPERKPISFYISHVDTGEMGAFDKPPQHIHNECEMYIHLGGDVAFMVEDRLYSLEHGSIIISRPGEYHHCVYYSDRHHDFYWILLKAEGNEDLLPLFFDRPKGHGNKIDLGSDGFGRVKKICEWFTKGGGSLIEAETKLMELLDTVQSGKQVTQSTDLPPDVSLSLSYIKEHIASPVTVEELAGKAFVSVNTLERHFADSLKMSPREYLRRVRLSKSEELLRSDLSIGQISDLCGFADHSHFISVFRKHYGLTPLQYRKALAQNK